MCIMPYYTIISISTFSILELCHPPVECHILRKTAFQRITQMLLQTELFLGYGRDTHTEYLRHLGVAETKLDQETKMKFLLSQCRTDTLKTAHEIAVHTFTHLLQSLPFHIIKNTAFLSKFLHKAVIIYNLRFSSDILRNFSVSRRALSSLEVYSTMCCCKVFIFSDSLPFSD